MNEKRWNSRLAPLRVRRRGRSGRPVPAPPARRLSWSPPPGGVAAADAALPSAAGGVPFCGWLSCAEPPGRHACRHRDHRESHVSPTLHDPRLQVHGVSRSGQQRPSGLEARGRVGCSASAADRSDEACEVRSDRCDQDRPDRLASCVGVPVDRRRNRDRNRTRPAGQCTSGVALLPASRVRRPDATRRVALALAAGRRIRRSREAEIRRNPAFPQRLNTTACRVARG